MCESAFLQDPDGREIKRMGFQSVETIGKVLEVTIGKVLEVKRTRLFLKEGKELAEDKPEDSQSQGGRGWL